MSHPLVDRRTLARALGVSGRRVSQLIGEGRIPPPAERGRYDLAESARAYIADLRDRLGDAGPEFARARTRERTAKAALSELELQRRHGELLPREQVEHVWAQWMGVLASQLDALPAQLAPIALEAETHAQAMEGARRVVNDMRQRVSDAPIIVEDEP